MVFYFTDSVVSPPVTYFMGKDKYENEDLIKWGWPEDVWFHVDKLSSAHVYLRLNPGQTIDNLPKEIIENACQLVKANSIQGNKVNDVDIVYTMWSNLKKTPGMEAGQVLFFNDKEVKKFRVEKRKNEIINRLKKTMTEQYPADLRTARETRDNLERQEKKNKFKAEQENQKLEEAKKKQEAEVKSYSSIMKAENMTSNQDQSGYDSDDFW